VNGTNCGQRRPARSGRCGQTGKRPRHRSTGLEVSGAAVLPYSYLLSTTGSNVTMFEGKSAANAVWCLHGCSSSIQSQMLCSLTWIPTFQACMLCTVCCIGWLLPVSEWAEPCTAGTSEQPALEKLGWKTAATRERLSLGLAEGIHPDSPENPVLATSLLKDHHLAPHISCNPAASAARNLSC
jgi:hypothetical protein